MAADGTGSGAATPAAEAVYDLSQPGADDPRAKAGFDAYKAGDFKRAYEIWLPLADAGNAEAQFRIGRLYSFGEGVQQNGKMAEKWYQSAAEQEHLPANHSLGFLCISGKFGPVNVDRAINYYLFAAERGYARSQVGVATIYATDDGKFRDFAEAYKWLFIAERTGSDEAKKVIDLLGRLVELENRPDAKDEGMKRMREWLESHPR